jgi:GTP diphosphokinase / guanosine-3',5'-bis(diphosphate) 3'-diphosphatase
MATLERAIEIAASAHAGQFDKAGAPYILHPIRVMLRMNTVDEMIVAALHDVVEDSNWTVDDLLAEGFSEQIVEAVGVLTKLPDESRQNAAVRAREHPIARAVKLADNAENMDLTRIANPTAKDYSRLREYEKVRAILMGEGGS